MTKDTDYGPDGHRYNDDLLLGEEARKRAESEFADVYHIINNTALQDRFREVNTEANRSKRTSQVAGIYAVLLAFVALACAATESAWVHSPDNWPRIIAGVSGLMGLISALIAWRGFLYGTNKAIWLENRLYTERLRQYHFQSFVQRISAMAETISSEAGVTDYKNERDALFKEFEADFRKNRGAYLKKLLDPKTPPSVWLHGANVTTPKQPDSNADLSRIFEAYDVFRFAEQEGYARYMLRERNEKKEKAAEKANSKSGFSNWIIDQPLLRKRRWFDGSWYWAMIILVAMHVAIVAGQFLPVHYPHSVEKTLHVLIVVFALMAIAAKTLSEGFALTREIERYEEYYAVVHNLRKEFKAADSTAEKLRIMAELEEASYEEMRVFLRSNNEAKFVM